MQYKGRRDDEPVGLSGAPTEIDEYAAWFNQRFTFAKARVVQDQRGNKFIDLEYTK